MFCNNRFKEIGKHYKVPPFTKIWNTPSLQELISTKKLSHQDFVFKNQGPIDMMLNFSNIQTKLIIKGAIKRPFNLVSNEALVTIYRKADRLEATPPELITNDKEFNIEIESILYPVGMFIKIDLEGCYKNFMRV